MKPACEALESGDRSIGRAAEEPGYTDAAFFSRQFKHELECNAQAYRERCEENG